MRDEHMRKNDLVIFAGVREIKCPNKYGIVSAAT